MNHVNEIKCKKCIKEIAEIIHFIHNIYNCIDDMTRNDVDDKFFIAYYNYSKNNIIDIGKVFISDNTIDEEEVTWYELNRIDCIFINEFTNILDIITELVKKIKQIISDNHILEKLNSWFITFSHDQDNSSTPTMLCM